MTPTVRTCVLYARISLTKEESVSVERQLESCRKYAQARGWEILGEFVDDGVSATSNRPEDRKGWSQMLTTPGFDAVVIWKVDRLARKVLDFLHVHETLAKRGAGLVAVEDPVDMTTAQGRAFATILAVFGEMEAENIRARVKAARGHLIKQGRWPGGGVPYGYMSVDNPDGPGKILARDPERFEWLERIVARARRGDTINSIALWLEAEGAPVPVGRKAGDTTWHRQTVNLILRNPVVAGMRPHNPGRGRSGGSSRDPFAVVRDEHGEPVVYEGLAIITVEEFRELLAQLDANDAPQARKRGERMRTSAFLSKAVVCDECGVYMCRGTNQGKAVLACPKCRQTFSREHLDRYLIRRLLAERGDEPFADSTVRKQWNIACAMDDDARRRGVLLSQVESLRARRGVVGRAFDADRVLLTWKPSALAAEEVAA